MGRVAQWATPLLCKCGVLSLTTQNPCKSWAGMVTSYNPILKRQMGSGAN